MERLKREREVMEDKEECRGGAYGSRGGGRSSHKWRHRERPTVRQRAETGERERERNKGVFGCGRERPRRCWVSVGEKGLTKGF